MPFRGNAWTCHRTAVPRVAFCCFFAVLRIPPPLCYFVLGVAPIYGRAAPFSPSRHGVACCCYMRCNGSLLCLAVCFVLLLYAVYTA